MNTIKLVDTHAHICGEFENNNDIERIIEEARVGNLHIIINVGTNKKTSKQVVDIARNYDFIYASVGSHPTETYNESDMDGIEDLIKSSKKIIAIGETGLDWFHLESGNAPDKGTQIFFFRKHLDLAIKYNLPVLIHSRDAHEDIYKILMEKEYAHKIKGVVHTFSSNIEWAKKFIKLGFYISFSGVVTFKNATQTHEVAKHIPLEYMLTETDAPFLTPVPFRGTKNHTKNVQLVINKISELRNQPINEISNAILNNTRTLFKI